MRTQAQPESEWLEPAAGRRCFFMAIYATPRMTRNMIAVLGMSVLTGFTRLFSFGNAGFMSIGAYTAAICSVRYHLPFALSLLLGAAAAGFIAFFGNFPYFSRLFGPEF